ncbi:thioredoxin domain-containing protein [Fodinicola feengrottensis]|uniref:Thioredoxin domain-containing protein n=1 Tax=Fodinicola feengrottensis TaxID=435914 RepID=A0ABN2J9Z0_9ACTN
MNRLGSATSPYLLQHADNPVEWWEWSDAAFEEARRRDVPVLVSVGYAACHWCHVMAHESFENAEIAALVNENCVPIKVDREERPDVDAVYMEATQAMTGQGGWPMTVFATPDGQPFFCGTYFPPANFARLVSAVADAWQNRRDAVLKQSAEVVQALGSRLPAGGPLSAELVDGCIAVLHKDYDAARGGFGGAPKFPPSSVLEFLLRHHHRTGSAVALSMVEGTAEAMARGGMYDQLAGGFARYSVDATWTVPHFEKMLYDNALLLRAYTHLWQRTGSPLAQRVADETVAFLLTDVKTAEGAFAASLDADTDGVEGLTYAWTPDQLVEVLGPDNGKWAADLLSVTKEGTFEHGSSVLQLRTDPDDVDRWAEIQQQLWAARAVRPQPAMDDKVVASWNGLAITALVEYGVLRGSPSTVDLAASAGDLIWHLHFVDGRLRRASRHGVVGAPAGVLEDYAALAEAFLLLHQATGSLHWLSRAEQLLGIVLDHFADGEGGFFDTADDAEALVVRPAEMTDGATPSGMSLACEALLTYAALTGSSRHREAAEAGLNRLSTVMARAPRFAGWALAVAEAALAGPYQVAVAGDPDGTSELRRAAWAAGSPGAVVVFGEPDAPGVPLLADRPLVGGQPAAYPCRGFVCDLPLTEPGALRELLSPASQPEL